MPSIDLKDQYFGCEIEMTGLTRQQAAEAVASLFGTNAVHSRSSRTYDPVSYTHLDVYKRQLSLPFCSVRATASPRGGATGRPFATTTVYMSDFFHTT